MRTQHQGTPVLAVSAPVYQHSKGCGMAEQWAQWKERRVGIAKQYGHVLMSSGDEVSGPSYRYTKSQQGSVDRSRTWNTTGRPDAGRTRQ